MVKKNDSIELFITGYTAEGSGVGRFFPEENTGENSLPDKEGGIAVFVPGAAKGDRLRVRIVKTAKTYAFGRLEEILIPSQDRVEPGCLVSTQCGGCVFRHISYEAELKAKEERVREAAVRIGGIDGALVGPILGAPSPERYRNKAQFPIGEDRDGNLILGFYAHHSHRIVPCEDCLLQPEVFCRAMECLKTWRKRSGASVYDENTGKGLLRHLYLRRGEKTGEVMVCLVCNGERIPCEEEWVDLLRRELPGLASVLININREKTNVVLGRRCRTLWGKGTITDVLCGLSFELSPLSFYQVNPLQTERLYGEAARYAALTGEETLLDLYCGTGTIGLSMAAGAGCVIGAEIVAPAVENARENARRNGIENAEFLCGDAAEAAKTLEKRGIRPHVIVLDPPRKGCSPELIETVSRMGPRRVVYVSCDPATLARDIKLFDGFSYKVQAVTPVDMFPRTGHVESVALLVKNKMR
ncbi:MAG: 23S rRNA (uracil(1939)-C(5))-methyltransferase RlmD [Hydrogeniiclostridium sp.]